MKIQVQGYITHKEAEQYSDCADRYAYSSDTHRFAISDGVTKSFFPKIWSKILVDEFVALQGATDLSIESCQSKWLNEVTKKVTSPDVKWFAKNAFNQKKPGLATLITLRFDKNGEWHAKALGDSFLFFIPKGKSDIKDWLYLSSKFSSKKPESVVFDNFPDYYASIGEKNGIENEITGKLEDGRFYLMTDALSEWVFKEKEKALSEIETWISQEVFEERIANLRLQKNDALPNKEEFLNNDDSSILIIHVDDVGKHDFLYDIKNITDIEALIETERKNKRIGDVEKILDRAKDILGDHFRNIIREELIKTDSKWERIKIIIEELIEIGEKNIAFPNKIPVVERLNEKGKENNTAKETAKEIVKKKECK